MNKAAFEDYLKNRYEEQMSYYAKSSRENRDKYRKFQWSLIILSAITPVLVALDGVRIAGTDEHPIMFNIKLIVVIISSIVAILTTGLKTFNYFENYVRYRNTREDLKREIHYYNFRIGPYGEPGVHRESMFVSRVETILDKEHAQWPANKKLEEQEKEKGKEQQGQQEEPTVTPPPADTPAADEAGHAEEQSDEDAPPADDAEDAGGNK